MRPLTDNPVLREADDAFGFLPYVQALHEAVADADPLPLTVGIFGSWGTGKSSFLGMWQDLFKADDQARTIWFNPWKYDRKVEVWAALLHTILAEIESEERLRDKAARLARAATWLSMRAGLGGAASMATGGVLGGQQVNDLIDTFTTADSEQYRQVNAFEHNFAEAVEEFVGPEGRLVVFVDDLDRCTPESAVTVLESLKLFLGQARCVFVLALDVDVLAAIATNKFGEALKGAPQEAVSGMAYLEKIVQLPFFLPEIGFPTLRAALGRYAGELGDSEAFWDLVRLGLGGNPRRVKRYINVLNLALLASGRTNPAGQTAGFKLQLAELLIIRGQHRAFFHLLTREPGAWQTLENIAVGLARQSGQRTLLLSSLPANLMPFADDEALMRLLATGPGGYIDHPPAPDGQQVIEMISSLEQAAGPTSGIGAIP